MADDAKLLKRFPVALPGGDILPYMSGRRRMAIMDAVFEAVGGQRAMEEWITRDDANRGLFYSWWVRGALRASADDETTRTSQIEELLARLDAGESAKVISGVVSEPDQPREAKAVAERSSVVRRGVSEDSQQERRYSSVPAEPDADGDSSAFGGAERSQGLGEGTDS